MDGQLRHVIQQKIVDAQAAALPRLTHRDVWLPSVSGKVYPVDTALGPLFYRTIVPAEDTGKLGPTSYRWRAFRHWV